jgi:hypothetical protein
MDIVFWAGSKGVFCIAPASSGEYGHKNCGQTHPHFVGYNSDQ